MDSETRILLAWVFAVVLCGGLFAQASVNLNGSTYQGYEFWQVIEVDHGPTPQNLTLDLTIQAPGGAGLMVSLIDLDELAKSGAPGSLISGSDPGSGSINLSLNTASYSGVVEYVMAHRPFGTIDSNYDGTLTCTSLPSGSISLGEEWGAYWPGQTASSPLYKHGLQIAWEPPTKAGHYITHEFEVDFGSSPKPLPFHMRVEGPVNTGAQLWEIREDGSSIALLTIDHAGPGTTTDNGMTTTRKGKVRMLVTYWQYQPGQTRIRVLFHSTLRVTNHQVLHGNSCGCATCSTAAETRSPKWLAALLLTLLVATLRWRPRTSLS